MQNEGITELFCMLLGVYLFSVAMFSAEKLSPHLPDFIAKHSILVGMIPLYNTILAIIGLVKLVEHYIKQK